MLLSVKLKSNSKQMPLYTTTPEYLTSTEYLETINLTFTNYAQRVSNFLTMVQSTLK